MDLAIGTTGLGQSGAYRRLAAVRGFVVALVEAGVKATSDLIRSAGEGSVRRFKEWAAIGFAITGYTPL